MYEGAKQNFIADALDRDNVEKDVLRPRLPAHRHLKERMHDGSRAETSTCMQLQDTSDGVRCQWHVVQWKSLELLNWGSQSEV